MDAGKLVTDELVIALVKERIAGKTAVTVFWFPRTIRDWQMKKRVRTSWITCTDFDVPDRLIVDRIVGRRVHTPPLAAFTT